ncbi:MAG: hypothetical protein JJU27_13050 [Gammaproteobacteria bacterium]|nr:hypothetical protein [Gammaproteobacteria bacterium]
MYRFSVFAAAVCLVMSAMPAQADERVVPTACDLLAAHPSDPDKIVEGLSQAKIMPNIDATIDACRRDVEAHGDVPRLVYYLGRVLFYAGEFQEGIGYVNRAADMGHRQSQFVSAFVYFDGVPGAIPADACRALGLWQDAAARGHYAASLTVARHALAGRFAACEDVPSKADMHGWVAAAAEADQAGDFYHGLLNGLLLELLQSDAS